MIDDTIYAVASPPGSAARGILRLSGPEARAAAGKVLSDPPPTERAAIESAVRVLGSDVRCLVLTMPAPHSYTGEDVVELHLPGGPVLLDEVAAAFAPEARLATPGEFTRRAFTNGRLDLAEAEAVLGLIHAADLEAGRFALDVLSGGLGETVDKIRATVQDSLALLEAGLDFTEGETGAVDPGLWLPGVRAARSRCAEVIAGLPRVGVHGEVLVLGAANAGKSALCNALVGLDSALVADLPGTTRDVLAFEIAPGLRLLDGPGDRPGDRRDTVPVPGVEAQALGQRDALAKRVAAVLSVVDLTAPRPTRTDRPVLARVFTKCDVASAAVADRVATTVCGSPPDCGSPPTFVVSSVTGAGIVALKEFLCRAMAGGPAGLGDRLHTALQRAAACLERTVSGAGGTAEAGLPEEVLCLELQTAIGELDGIHGRSSPEDVLDRIFAGFCLGK